MILFRYMARRYLFSFLGVLAVMAGILLLIDMVEQLRRFAGDGVGLAGALRLSALRMPASLHAVLPLVAILAALAMFAGLARSSELVVARAVGRSGLHVAAAPALVALVLGAVAVAVLNPVVAATTRHYDAAIAQLGGGDTSLLSISRDGLWLREGAEDRQRVIRATRADADGTVLHGVTILTFDARATPVARIEATRATLEPGAWALEGVKRWDLTDRNPEAGAETLGDLRLATALTATALRDSFGAPATIPVWELPSFIAALERAGFAALSHRMWLQMELALPWTLMAMVLVGAAFSMGHVRAGGQGVMVLAALLAGFGVFFLRDFAQVLGENGQIPVMLAAWNPPAVALLLALALMLHREEA